MSRNRTITTITNILPEIKQKMVELYQKGESITSIQKNFSQYGYSFNTIKRIVRPEWEQRYREIQAKYNNKKGVKEKKIDATLEWQKDPINKVKLSEKFKQKWKTNKEFREKRSDRFKEWFKKNGKEYCRSRYQEDLEYSRQMVRDAARRRRAKRRSLNEYYTKADEAYTRQLFENKCAICGSNENLTIDHWLPLSKGHTLTRQNAVLMCQHCNCSKSWKMPKEVFEKKIVDKIESKLLN